MSTIIINNTLINKTKLLLLIAKGKKLQAIKSVRDQLNIGLKESKDIVDRLTNNPDYFDGKPNFISTDLSSPLIPEDFSQFQKKGNHIIDDPSKTKNYVILILLISLITMMVLYIQK
ncbi:hypothetical protein DZC78_14615 [Olleya aquimaris]|uniref:Ribosomal protein L7/L12 n=1 Tax=Olleya sediminilitoris TaxID=2795739 RepID=A0ABS1WKM2_9FLAO|nr:MULTISPECIES: ribosomal protein L7/L12 [Olleya]AXO81566.1 hypothetical protein DZC78_14615 [Olleya aquimaris]MBL7559666.1 ribosomal protein L7/L12 [Olleya sediminilitoris]